MARLLLATHIYPPAVDGGSTVIYKLGEYFKKNNHQIMVLTSDGSSTDDFTHRYHHLRQSNKDIFRLPVYTFFHRPLKLISRILSKGPIFKIIPFLLFLKSYFTFRPDFIIAGPMPTTIILYARVLRFFTGAKLIISPAFHPTDPDFSSPLLINTLKSADYVWTLTDFETDYFVRNFAIPHSKLINLGGGIDASLLADTFNPQKPKTLLFIGSFAKHKNLETLFKAFALLPKEFSLTIAGKPTLHPLSIPRRVTVIKNFKSDQLADLLDRSTILISPSTQESFGLVLLEAMARGKPVIAADIPASAEIIKKSGAGLLFKPNNPQDLAAKIIQLYRSPNLNHFRLNALSYASQHTWDKIGDSLWQKIS